ncbi:MAG TPA: ATP-binding protein [Candidatus Paceibacterota bacterium]
MKSNQQGGDMEIAKNIPRDKLPNWLTKEILEPFDSGLASVFILHGDINCLISDPYTQDQENRSYIKFREFWRKILMDNEMVIFYNIASGIGFLKPGMETEFKKAAGIIDPPTSTGASAVSAARADLANKRALPNEPALCLELIDKALRNRKGIVTIINSAHFIAPTSGGTPITPNDRINTERLRNWSQSEKIRENGNLVVLVSDQASKISEELRLNGNEIRIAYIPKPEANERRIFIKTYTSGSETQKNILRKLRTLRKIFSRQESGSDTSFLNQQISGLEEQIKAFPDLYELDPDLNLEIFTVATQGLSLTQIKEILVQNRKSGLPLSLSTVNEKKHDILSSEYSDVMEIVNPIKGFEDIGGMDHIKKFLISILDAIRKGDTRRVPMGITLMGPPGTGKTAIVEALAKEAGFHMVKKKNLRSKWVGDSEDRNEKFINGVRSLVPIVIMNDEADLGEANRDSPKGDSGVSERMMQSWMTFLSDPRIRGKVIVINCTNRADRIDPALKRSGRSDKRILLPMPAVEEMPAIFEVMFRRYSIKTNIKDFGKYAEMIDGRSGADIEAISLSALDFAGRNQNSEDEETIVDDAALVAAIRDFIPSASQADIDYMTMVSLLESSSRELLPNNIVKIVDGIQRRNLIPNLDSILSQIRERNIVSI